MTCALRFTPYDQGITLCAMHHALCDLLLVSNVNGQTPYLLTGWNEWLGTMFTKDDFLFLGPRHRFYLGFSNKSFGTRQTFLLI
jgi:hypothetical protein